jgi:hypothetical protein
MCPDCCEFSLLRALIERSLLSRLLVIGWSVVWIELAWLDACRHCFAHTFSFAAARHRLVDG